MLQILAMEFLLQATVDDSEREKKNGKVIYDARLKNLSTESEHGERKEKK